MKIKKKILTLDDYQRAASRTAIYPHQGKNLIYTVIGLCGEAGELANKVKKLMRSSRLEPGTHIYSNKELIGELGGILWYLSQCCTELGVTFNDVGIDNLNELSNRVKRDNVEGEGDDRGTG